MYKLVAFISGLATASCWLIGAALTIYHYLCKRALKLEKKEFHLLMCSIILLWYLCMFLYNMFLLPFSINGTKNYTGVWILFAILAI